MQALIIAAGEGTRLRTRGPSKPLVELQGKPLVAHVIERLKTGGVTSCVVVTGYLRDQLEPELARISQTVGIPIQTVANDAWHLANGVSVLAARPLLAETFLLSMCDHLVDPAIIARVRQAATPARPGLAVDFNMQNPDVDMDDVTRVFVERDAILKIGKHLPSYNGFDCGIFAGSAVLLTALETVRQTRPSVSISDGVAALAAPLRAIDVTGLRWIDVDDAAMFERASVWVAAD